MKKTERRPSLTEILNGPRPKHQRASSTPGIMKLRKAEQVRRWNLAVTQATKALRILHYEDYKAFKAEAWKAVNAKLGPMPGDNGDDS